jgi:hypothetical protein
MKTYGGVEVQLHPPGTPVAILMKLGVYMMPPEPISTAHFVNPSHQYYQHYRLKNF